MPSLILSGFTACHPKRVYLKQRCAPVRYALVLLRRTVASVQSRELLLRVHDASPPPLAIRTGWGGAFVLSGVVVANLKTCGGRLSGWTPPLERSGEDGGDRVRGHGGRGGRRRRRELGEGGRSLVSMAKRRTAGHSATHYSPTTSCIVLPHRPNDCWRIHRVKFLISCKGVGAPLL